MLVIIEFSVKFARKRFYENDIGYSIFGFGLRGPVEMK